MNLYILSQLAKQDLVCIRDYYLKRAGERIARQMLTEFVEAFRLIARNPGIGHRRRDLLEERPVLLWGVRDFLVLYKTGSDPLEIVTIVHASRDIPKIVTEREI